MGRPKSTSLVTLDEAIDLLDKQFHWDAEKRGRHAFSRQTLYNAIYRGELTRHGPRHVVLLDKSEVIQRFAKNAS